MSILPSFTPGCVIEHVTQSPIRPLASDPRSGRDDRNLREAESSVAWALRLDGRRCHARGGQARTATVLILEDLIKQIHRSRWNRIPRSQTNTGNVKGLVTAGQSKLANEKFTIGTVAPHEGGKTKDARPSGCMPCEIPSRHRSSAPAFAPPWVCTRAPPPHRFRLTPRPARWSPARTR